MKKFLAFILVALMMFTTFSFLPFNANADFPDPEEAMDGYENLCLTYTYNPKRDDFGRHTAQDLAPYVAYYDKKGNVKDFFFDSYLFLPCMQYGVSGARMHYDTNNPTKAVDWESYVNDTFSEGTNVDALEAAFGEAKQKLGDSERKAGVVFTILYPGYGEKNFGSLGGRNLDFSKLDDRKYAVKWIIDEQIKLYNERNYQHLDLIGFYWLEEYLVTYGNKSENTALYKYASDYLHSLGLKFIWIPWYHSQGYDQWRELGFDVSCMQPNMFWQTTPTPNRVPSTVKECASLGMGTEMEVDGRALVDNGYYNRYLDYLEGCMQNGAMDTIKMYYQDGKPGVYYRACHSENEMSRSVYDLTYKYAKGTLTQADIDDHRMPEFSFDEDVEWRSFRKSYTTSGAYQDGNGAQYQNIDGKELTDGVIGVSDLGTEWHGFHNSLVDSENRMSAVVDLGAVYNDLTHFAAHFSHIQRYGIGAPSDIRISVSTDGVVFKDIANPDLMINGVTSYVIHHTAPVTARYVKFSFITEIHNFVFCSELLVGAGEPPKVVYKNGDINKDGAINQYDYVLLKRHYFDTRKLTIDEQTRSDIDNNGKINQYDYILIARHYFGTYKIQ